MPWEYIPELDSPLYCSFCKGEVRRPNYTPCEHCLTPVLTGASVPNNNIAQESGFSVDPSHGPHSGQVIQDASVASLSVLDPSTVSNNASSSIDVAANEASAQSCSSSKIRNLHALQNYDRTPFHLAAQFGDADSAKQIMEQIPLAGRPPLICLKDTFGKTALHLAANVNLLVPCKKRPYCEVIILVLQPLPLADRFHCLSVQDEQERTVYHELFSNCKEADLAELKIVLSLPGRFGSQLLKIKDKEGLTPLDVANPIAKKLLSDRHRPPSVMVFDMTNGRDGAPAEVEVIVSAFQPLGIEPIACKNITTDLVLSRIKNASDEALIVIIMSHGKDGYLEDAAGRLLNIQELLQAFGGNDGIPKILVIQARSGSTGTLQLAGEMPGNMAARSATASALPVSGSFDAQITSTIGLETSASEKIRDCLLFYEESCKRNDFMTIFAKCIQEDGKQKDIHEIAKTVQREMRERNQLQVCYVHSTMTRPFCIGDFNQV